MSGWIFLLSCVQGALLHHGFGHMLPTLVSQFEEKTPFPEGELGYLRAHLTQLLSKPKPNCQTLVNKASQATEMGKFVYTAAAIQKLGCQLPPILTGSAHVTKLEHSDWPTDQQEILMRSLGLVVFQKRLHNALAKLEKQVALSNYNQRLYWLSSLCVLVPHLSDSERQRAWVPIQAFMGETWEETPDNRMDSLPVATFLTHFLGIPNLNSSDFGSLTQMLTFLGHRLAGQKVEGLSALMVPLLMADSLDFTVVQLVNGKLETRTIMDRPKSSEVSVNGQPLREGSPMSPENPGEIRINGQLWTSLSEAPIDVESWSISLDGQPLVGIPEMGPQSNLVVSVKLSRLPTQIGLVFHLNIPRQEMLPDYPLADLYLPLDVQVTSWFALQIQGQALQKLLGYGGELSLDLYVAQGPSMTLGRLNLLEGANPAFVRQQGRYYQVDSDHFPRPLQAYVLRPKPRDDRVVVPTLLALFFLGLPLFFWVSLIKLGLNIERFRKLSCPQKLMGLAFWGYVLANVCLLVCFFRGSPAVGTLQKLMGLGPLGLFLGTKHVQTLVSL